MCFNEKPREKSMYEKELQYYLSTKDPVLFAVSGRHIGGYTFDPLHAYTLYIN